MKNERRVSARVQTDLLANAFVEGQPGLSHIVNLSEDGLVIRGLRGLGRVADRFGVQFELPGRSEVIYAEAKLVTRRGADIVVKFTLLMPRYRTEIQSFISKSLRVRSAFAAV